MEGFYNYNGIIHCHSIYSDGCGTPATILKAAARTGCHFVILTDHNTLAARQNGWEGWHNNTLLLGRMFRALRTHIITRQPFSGNVEHDSKLIFDALSRGNCYFGYETNYPIKSFIFTGENEKTRAIMGETLELGKISKLTISLPRPCLLHLVRNGKYTILTRSKTRVYVPINSPGSYRVEAHYHKSKRTFPWIFSNHIHIT